MKKFGQIVLVFLLSVGMFTGCGTSYKADESTVFVLKDGKIVSTDVENFDEKTYSPSFTTMVTEPLFRVLYSNAFRISELFIGGVTAF